MNDGPNFPDTSPYFQQDVPLELQNDAQRKVPPVEVDTNRLTDLMRLLSIEPNEQALNSASRDTSLDHIDDSSWVAGEADGEFSTTSDEHIEYSIFPFNGQSYVINENQKKSGGFSEVFYGRRVSDQQMIVVKIASKQCRDEDGLRQFPKTSLQREIEYLKQLWNVDEQQMDLEQGILILPCIHGMSLYDFLKGVENGTIFRPPLLSKLGIMQNINRGLMWLRREGIVHLDLKLKNMIINDQGHVTLIDFGLALPHGAITHRAGTYLYMDPFQRKKGQNVLYATDIFALGKVFQIFFYKSRDVDLNFNHIPTGKLSNDNVFDYCMINPFFVHSGLSSLLRAMTIHDRPLRPSICDVHKGFERAIFNFDLFMEQSESRDCGISTTVGPYDRELLFKGLPCSYPYRTTLFDDLDASNMQGCSSTRQVDMLEGSEPDNPLSSAEHSEPDNPLSSAEHSEPNNPLSSSEHSKPDTPLSSSEHYSMDIMASPTADKYPEHFDDNPFQQELYRLKKEGALDREVKNDSDAHDTTMTLESGAHGDGRPTNTSSFGGSSKQTFLPGLAIHVDANRKDTQVNDRKGKQRMNP